MDQKEIEFFMESGGQSPWQALPKSFRRDCAASRLFLSFDVSAVTST